MKWWQKILGSLVFAMDELAHVSFLNAEFLEKGLNASNVSPALNGRANNSVYSLSP